MNSVSNKKYFFYVLLMVGIFIGLIALAVMAAELGSKLFSTVDGARWPELFSFAYPKS